jgi:hypothetical protein
MAVAFMLVPQVKAHKKAQNRDMCEQVHYTSVITDRNRFIQSLLYWLTEGS